MCLEDSYEKNRGSKMITGSIVGKILAAISPKRCFLADSLLSFCSWKTFGKICDMSLCICFFVCEIIENCFEFSGAEKRI